VESQPVPPEQCLRSLTAEALLMAQPGRELLPDSLGVMATANAFVMLGLVAEDHAEQILTAHRAALEAKGVAPGRGVDAGEICFEWLTLTRSGWRMSYRANGSRAKAEPEARGTPEPPRVTAEQVLAQVAVIDDTGHRYQLTAGRGSGWLRTGRHVWELHGEATAAPNLDLPGRTA
jgi:hypothetical protein